MLSQPVPPHRATQALALFLGLGWYKGQSTSPPQPQELQLPRNPALRPLAAQGVAEPINLPGVASLRAQFGLQPGLRGLDLISAEIRGKRAAGFQGVKAELGSGTSATPQLLTRDVSNNT